MKTGASDRWKSRVLACFCGVATAASALGGEWTNESFETGLGAWTPAADATTPADPRWTWSVDLSGERASDGEWSVALTASGVLADGTVWIARPLELGAGTWEISVRFDLWSETETETESWEVKACVGALEPIKQIQFGLLGKTGVAGWSSYGFTKTIHLSGAATTWVALGYRVSTDDEARTYYLDNVRLAWHPTMGFRSFRRGDANRDGKVDVSDPISTLRWTFLGTGDPTCLDALDSDDDGGIDTSDAIFSLHYLFLSGLPIPYPGPRHCDLDFTPDALGCDLYEPCVCAGLPGIPCQDESEYFCDLTPGFCGGAADLQGSCVPVPRGCPDFIDPVCGCNGATYGNECERIQARVQKNHDGPCL